MKPILFNTEMVQAILQGRKTVTRRLVKPQPWCDHPRDCGCTLWNYGEVDAACPAHCISTTKEAYQPGDILWVRETWAPFDSTYLYKANGGGSGGSGWRPSIHMPREAARIFLRVTDVRVERLQEITAEECICEGVDSGDVLMNTPDNDFAGYAKERFAALWDSTVKTADLATYGYDANPWVWVIEFERCERGVTHD